MIGSDHARRVPRCPAKGFTFVEILIVLTLMGLVALPFTRMFVFGVQGSHENAEAIIAHNLAREKIEEIRSLPFELVKDDFENFRTVYRDRVEFEKAFESRAEFEKIFTDVLTREGTQDPDGKETLDRLVPLYKAAYRRDLEIYGDDLKGFRRVLEVDERYDSAIPPRMKKVSVRVYDRQGHKQAEVVTLVSRHK
ncbi:MAG: type II secretion system protein [Candidatus Riflebacteria bacterium]|nr:type II secretion system protein [Candidatus Riflebacteria bacterium]